eukprot:651565-Amphidinium_carterae.1
MPPASSSLCVVAFGPQQHEKRLTRRLNSRGVDVPSALARAVDETASLSQLMDMVCVHGAGVDLAPPSGSALKIKQVEKRVRKVIEDLGAGLS